MIPGSKASKLGRELACRTSFAFGTRQKHAIKVLPNGYAYCVLARKNA